MTKPKCHDCGRKFRNDSALTMHARAKHPKQVQRRMMKAQSRPFRKGWPMALFVGSAVIAIAFVIATHSKAEVNSKGLAVTLHTWHITVTPTKR